MTKSLKNRAISAAFGALALGSALSGAGCANTSALSPLQNPQAVPAGTTNVNPSGRVDYTKPSPAYTAQVASQPYAGPSYPNVPAQPELYYQAWGFQTFVQRDGSPRSFEGCWNVLREKFLDADGAWKSRDRVIGGVQKPKLLCYGTNPLSPLIRQLPTTPPYSQSSGEPRYLPY